MPGFPLDVTFNVSGLSGNISDLAISMTFGSPHTWAGDLVVTLYPPLVAPSLVIFGYTGATTVGFGDSSDLAGPYTFSDDAVGDWWAAASATLSGAPIPSGSYRTSAIGGNADGGVQTSINAVFGGMTPEQAGGVWSLRFTDGGSGDTGSISAATLTFAVPEPSTPAHSGVAAGVLGVAAWRRRRAARAWLPRRGSG